MTADRLDWPAEAVGACHLIEGEYPRWTVFWTDGAATGTEPGYRATIDQQGYHAELYSSTAEELLGQVATVDAQVLPPVGEELAWRNRQVIAERTGWPDGALEACEEIERAHPGWYPNWQPENTIKGFEYPEGFYAVHRDWRGRGDRPVYGRDPAALTRALMARA